MKRLTSIGIVALMFTFALVGTVLAAEQDTKTETPKEEQVAKPSPDDKIVDQPTDTAKQSWSNVKALWE